MRPTMESRRRARGSKTSASGRGGQSGDDLAMRTMIPGPLRSWVTPSAAPTLCIHGTEDKYVAHEQAVWLVERLKAADVEAELVTLDGAGHGFQGKDAETAEKAMVGFFANHLQKK